MKKERDNKRDRFFYFLLLSLFITVSVNGQRKIEDFNWDWKFSNTELVPCESISFNDKEWRDIRLPHDWSVEYSFDSINGEGCTGYLPGGVGWYRKHFKTNHLTNQKVYIYFDGVYNNSEYWINGKKLGFHPYGYSPFYFDITPYLKEEGNVIAVKVDRTRTADSRWYTGSGIYRNVKLIYANKLHIANWGTFITTPEVNNEYAEISIDVRVSNDFNKKQTFDLHTDIIDATGKVVKQIKDTKLSLTKGQKQINQSARIENPKLWHLDSPVMYQAVTKVVQKGKTVDTYNTKFGIRTFRFDKDLGFFLNGENMKIKGVCLHHDAGLVGAAVPKNVWRQRFQTLKDGGCNAIRVSHNPASEEFLELCDEMGFIVQEEFFDEWDFPKDKRLNCWEQHDDYLSRGYAEHFQEWAERDLRSTMFAHRNHPSIIQWSIGNEIEWTFPRNRTATGFFDNMDWEGNYFWSPPPFSPEKIRSEYNKLPALDYAIEQTATKLANWTRELDTTRPVIANCILPSASFQTGYADQLDIVGFSYRRVMYDYAKKFYPDKIIMGTENVPQWHEWKAVAERPFVSGLFLWTGIDHMGEMHGSWPQKSASRGIIDQAGFTKPAYHMFKSLWTENPHIFICSQSFSKLDYIVNDQNKIVDREPDAWKYLTWDWPELNEHWNYKKDEKVLVEVLSNCEEVELFLNKRSLGKKKLSEFPDRIYKWIVPFQEGTLIAKGIKDGKTISETLITAGTPVTIEIKTDKTELLADGYQAANVTVQLKDKKGNPVKHINKKLLFEVDGKVKNLGVDNGYPSNTQDYKSNEIITHNGRALMVIQSKQDIGKSTIHVTAKDMKSAKLDIHLIQE